MLIGASMGQDDIPNYKGMLAGNHIFRIFPVTKTVGGASVKVPPPWTDSRLIYAKDSHVIPFVSSKGNGTDAFVAYMKDYFINMPSWATLVYYCDWHEPEADFGAGSASGITKYKTEQTKMWNMITALPAAVRAKVKFGHVMTKQWVESSSKGDFDYSKYDAGIGDFFGIDSYVLSSSGPGGTVVTPSSLVSPANFLSTIKAYKFNSGDTRPRFFPELGLIGMPADTTGNARATWLQGVHNELKTWKVGTSGWTQPWSFAGWIWWHQTGKATGAVDGIGQRRDFPLHLRTKDATEAVTLPGTPPAPVATYNAIWTAENSGGVVTPPDPVPDPPPDPVPDPNPGTGTPVWTYWVGASMKKADIPLYEPKLTRNGMFRIFPNSNGLPPAWDDDRFEYARRTGAVPFVSSNIDGDSSKFAAMKQWIIDMPQWLKDRPGVVLYLTDRHEPENNFKNQPQTYITNYTNWWNACIQTLPSALRAKVMAGPVVTLQWIVNPNNGNDNYAQYDPGPAVSDFYGIDMYMNSWKPGSSQNATLVADAYLDPATFLAGVKAYKYNFGDHRPRVFAEMGAIGIPTDPTGSQRAAWFNGLCAQLDTWTEAAQGWKFLGFAWWNNIGTTGSSLTPIGTARYFFLDKYQNSSGVLTAYADPLPLKAYNQQANSHYTLVTGGGGTGTPGQGAVALAGRSTLSAAFVGAPSTTIPPPVVVPPIGGTPATGPAADRALRAIYTVLVTDAYLSLLGDPLMKWSQMQITLRWKEPGSGQITIPADSYVREQLVPGCRIVVLRRVLGTQHVLIAGPMESVLWEKSNDADTNAGVGEITVTFTDDLAWLGARLTYPDPSKTPDQQTGDFWTYSGNPEQAMLQLVATQAGPLALAARQVPKLAVAPYSGLSDASVQIVGTSDVAPREKYEKVTDVLRRICTLGANSLIPGAKVYHPDSLGFRARQTVIDGEPAIVFEPLRSRDLTGEVHFSFGKGNLKYFSFELTAPSATALVIGGSGDGADAYVREVITQEPGASTWGRFEGYRSESGSDIQDNARLKAAADEEFAEKLPGARLASNASDTPDQRYGIHYNVGDIVSIELAPGRFEVAPVQTVALQAFPTAGEVVGVTIGDQSARYDSPFIQRYRDLDRRLGRIERRGERA